MKKTIAIIVLTLLTLAACNSSSDDSPSNVPKDIRVYNSMIDKGDYELTLNDRSLDSSAVFNLYAGSTGVYVEVTRKSDSTIVFEQFYELGSATSEELDDYSLFISGSFNDLQVLLMDDNQITVPPTGKAQIRLANLSTNKGAVDIYVVSNISDCAPLNVALTPTANLAVGEKTVFIEVDESATGVCYFPEGAASPSSITTVDYGTKKTLTGAVVDDGAGDQFTSYMAP